MKLSKRILSLILCLLLGVLTFTGCKDKESEASKTTNNLEEDTGELSGKLTFWHFNKDDAPALANAFMKAHPKVKIDVQITSDTDNAYQQKVESTIRSGEGMPDVYASENAFVKRFVELPGGYAKLDFDDVEDVTSQLVPYTIKIGTNSNGDLVALSHQSAAGGIGYKRELAKKYLGTDDPKTVGEMLATPEKILETGRKVKEASDGKVKLFAGNEELFKIFLGSREKPWVVDDKFYMDPKMEEYIDLAKKMRDEGLDGGLPQWEPAWSASIQDDIHMCYAIPTWGVNWIIDTNEAKGIKVMESDDGNGGGEGGRWAITTPIPYYEGGTWFGISQKSKNKELAWEFIKFITTNEDFLLDYGKTDFVSNKIVIDKMKNDDSVVSKVVNDNLYKVYGDMIDSINGDILTKYDDIIKKAFNDSVKNYLAGESTKKELMKLFKEKIANDLAGKVKVE